MTVKRVVLVPVRDTTEHIPTTFKIALVMLPDGKEEVWIHQIPGSHEKIENFDKEWNRRATTSHSLEFTSLSVEDARELAEAINEITRAQAPPVSMTTSTLKPKTKEELDREWKNRMTSKCCPNCGSKTIMSKGKEYVCQFCGWRGPWNALDKRSSKREEAQP